ETTGHPRRSASWRSPGGEFPYRFSPEKRTRLGREHTGRRPHPEAQGNDLPVRAGGGGGLAGVGRYLLAAPGSTFQQKDHFLRNGNPLATSLPGKDERGTGVSSQKGRKVEEMAKSRLISSTFPSSQGPFPGKPTSKGADVRRGADSGELFR